MHSCSKETHNKCENSALCHLCDGVRLYKNSKEEFAEKMKRREQNKLDEKNAAFRTHKAEKKEGMAFEKAVAAKWNSAFNRSTKEETVFKQPQKKTKIQKPRIQLDEPEPLEPDKPKEPSIPYVALSSLGTTSNKKIEKRPIVDAKRQVNSGALWYAKGDIKTQDYLMECKERGTLNARGEKTITIPKEWLTKQELEAFQENRPFWAVPFRYKNDETIYMVKSFDHEIEMYQELRRLREENERLQVQTNRSDR